MSKMQEINKISFTIVCLWIIITQILALATWFLPIPYDIKLMLFLYQPIPLCFMHIGTCLSILLGTSLLINFWWKEMKKHV